MAVDMKQRTVTNITRRTRRKGKVAVNSWHQCDDCQVKFCTRQNETAQQEAAALADGGEYVCGDLELNYWAKQQRG